VVGMPSGSVKWSTLYLFIYDHWQLFLYHFVPHLLILFIKIQISHILPLIYTLFQGVPRTRKIWVEYKWKILMIKSRMWLWIEMSYDYKSLALHNLENVGLKIHKWCCTQEKFRSNTPSTERPKLQVSCVSPWMKLTMFSKILCWLCKLKLSKISSCIFLQNHTSTWNECPHIQFVQN